MHSSWNQGAACTCWNIPPRISHTLCPVGSLPCMISLLDITSSWHIVQKPKSLSQEQDSYLMDVIHNLGIFSDDQLCDINICHLHLQVSTLSDIVDGSGTHIMTESFNGAPLTDWFSSLKWPCQPVVTTYQQNL